MEQEKRKRGRPRAVDSEQTIMLRLRIKPTLLEQVKAAAAEKNSNMTAIITAGVQLYLAAQK